MLYPRVCFVDSCDFFGDGRREGGGELALDGIAWLMMAWEYQLEGPHGGLGTVSLPRMTLGWVGTKVMGYVR